MAFKLMSVSKIIVFVFVVISFCHSLPINTTLEELSDSELDVFAESARENSVTDKSDKIVKDDVMAPIVEHKILKRSPGLIKAAGCAINEHMSARGCVPCDGDCNFDYQFDESLLE